MQQGQRDGEWLIRIWHADADRDDIAVDVFWGYDGIPEALRSLADALEPPPEDCITPCDEDCEEGSMHCADIHQVNWRKRHPGEPCPGIHVCGLGRLYNCCHPDGRNRVITLER